MIKYLIPGTQIWRCTQLYGPPSDNIDFLVDLGTKIWLRMESVVEANQKWRWKQDYEVCFNNQDYKLILPSRIYRFVGLEHLSITNKMVMGFLINVNSIKEEHD
jgi:hypothetical protein